MDSVLGFGFESEDSQDFVNEIISEQVLVSELEPMVTGNEYLEVILSKLNQIIKHNPIDELLQLQSILTEVNQKLAKIDGAKINKIHAYSEVQNILKKLPVPIEENKLFQVDMFKPTPAATLAVNYQPSLQKAIRFLIIIMLTN